ncbi:MAG: anthrone oxygenase family protein [Pseudomonadota bacterium]
MSIDITVYVCLFLGVSAALVGGVFQSFSDFVMAGLTRAAPAGGIESMQQLNRTVFRSLFIATFLALVPASILFALYAWFSFSGLPQRLIIFAAIIYLPLVFLVTAFGNVPMNEKLDKMDHTSMEAADYWQTYGRAWTRWNTIRTIGSIVTAGCYLFAAVSIT